MAGVGQGAMSVGQLVAYKAHCINQKLESHDE